MGDDDRRLQDAYRRAVPPPDHPSDEAWERLALNELGASEREALLDHVTRCAACAGLYRGLREFETEARAFDPGVPQRATVLPMRRWAPAWYGGLAAAAVLLLALLVPFHSGPPSPSPDGGDVVRSTGASAPIPRQPIGTVTGRPDAFVWQPIAGAERYRVELYRGDSSLSWSSEAVAGTRLPWPDGVVLPPGAYYWRVTALAGADRRVAADIPSPLVLFEIVAAPSGSVPKTR